ncbi:MAG: type II toxin-antitoxin system RelE family toxin [Symbiopectobacterium sp.]|uniref:type II toxin-antitoxin system RelE family toxin n=1 Tax=Symbiopectobacterium sp. TaxID=2952789 RepID=UPI0039E8225A
MTYFLDFDANALKEWRKLGSTIREQFKKKLAEILQNPHVESNRLRELPNCYKIKLRSSGYRMIYQVKEDIVTVYVVAIEKRERSAAYQDAAKRL